MWLSLRGSRHRQPCQRCGQSTDIYPMGFWHFPVCESCMPKKACAGGEPADSVPVAPCRAGKASPSVSIFARAPVCPDTCRYCRRKPCDVATVHDDHTCYNCEQRQLFPERIPAWELPDLPICDSWCRACATQRCCYRGAHDSHFCMRCERKGAVSFFFARCCLGKVPGGAPFSQLPKGDKQSRVDRP